jgi:hypothetical protein
LFLRDYWGDYSSTTVDEGTGHFWTIQQYAEPEWDLEYRYGLWINRIAAQ